MDDKTIRAILLARYSFNEYGIRIALDILEHSEDMIELFTL